jgi:hypothetical protein
MTKAPDWLSDFQTDMSSILAQPLTIQSGRLCSDPAGFPQDSLGRLGHQDPLPRRLAVYHEQRWARFFSAMQSEFPLFARLMGLWHFNRLAEAYLLSHPPRSYDLPQIADRFAPYVRSRTEMSRPAWLEEALAWDEAHRLCLAAPHEEDWQADNGRTILQLTPKTCLQLVEERWSLLDLRQRLDSFEGDDPVPLPAQHGSSRGWALVQREGRILTIPLEPLQLRLYRALAESPLPDALDQLSAEPTQLATLEVKLASWMQLSRDAGFWRKHEGHMMGSDLKHSE